MRQVTGNLAHLDHCEFSIIIKFEKFSIDYFRFYST